jgi:hypothetical protein
MKRTVPTPLRGARRTALADWLARAFREGDGVIDDIHLDQLVGPWDEISNGVEAAAYGCEMVAVAAEAIKTRKSLRGVKDVYVVLPLDDTKRVRLWTPQTWRIAGTTYEPPSLVLVKADSSWYRHDEEYFRRVDLPLQCSGAVTATYVSGRNFGSLDGVFRNTIFLRPRA